MALEQRRAGRPRQIHYPERDGKPMGETETHIREIMRLLQTLDGAFAGRLDVYVCGDLLLYYEEGNPRAVVVPDVFVAIGAPKLPPRRIYKLWEEGVPPTFVIEVTSPSTRREDQARKRALYARLGVAEYVLYDPLDEYLRPPLQGYRLEAEDYRAMATDAEGALLSEALNMRLLLVDGRLRLFRHRNGVEYLSAEERALLAEERILSAEERALSAEERTALAVEQADNEASRADAEARRADAEAVARREAERRVAELEALLRQREEP